MCLPNTWRKILERDAALALARDALVEEVSL
jgi:hypothetical protein